MKYYVYSYGCPETYIRGVYQKGESNNPNCRDPHWIDIEDKDLPQWIATMTLVFDLMFIGATKTFPHPSIYFDSKGNRFKQR